MIAPVGLVPLRCVRCETPVPAHPDEVAWVCAQCGQGLLLDLDRGLVPLDVHFAAGATTKGKGNPYWVIEGRVTLQRETHGLFGGQAEDSHRFWRQPRRFFVPAFTCPLDMLISLGTGLLSRPLDLEPGSPIPFAPVTLLPQDVPALVDFVVVAIEAERTDKVKEVHFSTQLSSPVLWVLPV